MASMIPFIFLALIAGSCLPTQAGINSQLNLWVRSPIIAATISFAVGTLGLIVYGLVLRIPRPVISQFAGCPWWIWSGGLLGAFFVASIILLAPKLGATSMVALVIAGQMLTSLFLDHFGLIGYQVQSISPGRMIGVACMIGGVVLIRIF